MEKIKVPLGDLLTAYINRVVGSGTRLEDMEGSYPLYNAFLKKQVAQGNQDLDVKGLVDGLQRKLQEEFPEMREDAQRFLEEFDRARQGVIVRWRSYLEGKYGTTKTVSF